MVINKVITVVILRFLVFLEVFSQTFECKSTLYQDHDVNCSNIKNTFLSCLQDMVLLFFVEEKQFIKPRRSVVGSYVGLISL